MIRSITVTNYRGESLELNLTKPEESGFVVAYINGLGPGKANINLTDISTTDGGLFNTARLSSRNITIGLVYKWGKESIEEIRHKSYKYFPIKRKLKLRIQTDTRTADIEGYVEANDPSIFSSSQGSEISIICPNPYFYAPEESVSVFSGAEPAFEFPFSNESLDQKLIEMGRVYYRNEHVVSYEGDVDTGITILMHMLGAASDITIYNLDTRESIYLNTRKFSGSLVGGFVRGDDVIISTVPGNKHVTLIREGVSTNILFCLGENPDWFKITKGENRFAYTGTGTENLQFRITNKVLYEGM